MCPPPDIPSKTDYTFPELTESGGLHGKRSPVFNPAPGDFEDSDADCGKSPCQSQEDVNIYLKAEYTDSFGIRHQTYKAALRSDACAKTSARTSTPVKSEPKPVKAAKLSEIWKNQR